MCEYVSEDRSPHYAEQTFKIPTSVPVFQVPSRFPTNRDRRLRSTNLIGPLPIIVDFNPVQVAEQYVRD
jgi:hypothetical protein